MRFVVVCIVWRSLCARACYIAAVVDVVYVFVVLVYSDVFVGPVVCVVCVVGAVCVFAVCVCCPMFRVWCVWCCCLVCVWACCCRRCVGRVCCCRIRVVVLRVCVALCPVYPLFCVALRVVWVYVMHGVRFISVCGVMSLCVLLRRGLILYVCVYVMVLCGVLQVAVMDGGVYTVVCGCWGLRVALV